MKFLVKILITGLAAVLCAEILPGIYLENYWWALVLALVLAFLNSVVKPILILVTIPATVLTLGAFLIVINAVIILLADWIIGAQFETKNFWWALFFSVLLSIVTSIFERIDKKDDNNGQHTALQ